MKIGKSVQGFSKVELRKMLSFINTNMRDNESSITYMTRAKAGTRPNRYYLFTGLHIVSNSLRVTGSYARGISASCLICKDANKGDQTGGFHTDPYPYGSDQELIV
jgi:hypothetical protein